MATSGRPSVVLVIVLCIGISLGAAASLLIGAATSHGRAPGAATLVTLPNWLLADALLGAGVAVIGLLLYYRFSGTALPIPGRVVTYGLVLFLLAILFVAAYHTLAVGGPAKTGSVSGGNGNSTGTGSGSTNGTGKNGTTVHGSGGFLWSPSLPLWLPFLIIVGIVLVVVAVAVPQVRRMFDDLRARGTSRTATPPTLAEMKGALEQAEQELALGGDPRTVILGLYGTVLRRLTPMVGSVEIETPEEIRAKHLVRLGIRLEAAEALTRLFEEARYSSHPLDDATADRARQAVRAALADLSRSAVLS